MQRKCGKRTNLRSNHSRILTGIGERGQTTQVSGSRSDYRGQLSVISSRVNLCNLTSDLAPLLRVLVPQLRLTTGHRNRMTRNEDTFHIRLDVKRISVSDHDVRRLA